MVDSPLMRTKRFAFTFIMHTYCAKSEMTCVCFSEKVQSGSHEGIDFFSASVIHCRPLHCVISGEIVVEPKPFLIFKKTFRPPRSELFRCGLSSHTFFPNVIVFYSLLILYSLLNISNSTNLDDKKVIAN